MKKILIPVDFSSYSEHASKLASKIARLSKSEAHLLHMIEIPKGESDMMSGGNYSIPQKIHYINKTKELLENFKEKLFHKKTTTNQAILFDKPTEGILNYTQKIDADLIVMGSKGHSKIKELLIGSNTHNIIQTSKTPVLIIKKDESKFKIKNLVFASEFKNEEKENIPLTKLIDFAQKFKTTFHLLKVNTSNNFENTLTSNEKMKKFIIKYGISKFTLNSRNDNTIEEGILNFTKEVNGDIIALESYGRSSLSHFFNKSITRYISQSATQPVIIFKT